MGGVVINSTPDATILRLRLTRKHQERARPAVARSNADETKQPVAIGIWAKEKPVDLAGFSGC
jgi:hypothetical protein